MRIRRHDSDRGNRKPFESAIDELTDDPRVMAAARLGELWGTDPVKLLDSSPEEWIIRYACAKVIEADRQKEQAEAGRASR
jgi:hypothetical protein